MLDLGVRAEHAGGHGHRRLGPLRRRSQPLPRSASGAYAHSEPCPYYDFLVSCADTEAHEVWLYGKDRFTLAHELGHQFDEQYLTDQVRAWFRVKMGADRSGAWVRPYGPNEWFADFYADCTIGNRRNSQEGCADRPSAKRLRRVCVAIRAIGMRTRN